MDIIEKLLELSCGHSGECGLFAVALKKSLNQESQLYALYHRDELKSIGYCHVVLKVEGTFYDFSGATTEEKTRSFFKDIVDKNICEYVFEEVSEVEALEFTKSYNLSDVFRILDELDL